MLISYKKNQRTAAPNNNLLILYIEKNNGTEMIKITISVYFTKKKLPSWLKSTTKNIIRNQF